MLQLLSQIHATTQPAPEELSLWLIIAVLGLVAVLLVVVVLWPRLRGGGSSERAPGGPTDLPLAQQRAVERDVQTLVHELSEMARKVGAQLDSRAARLEQLIRDADVRLEALRNGSPSPESSNGHANQAIPAPRKPELPAHEIDSRYREIYALMDEGLNPYQIADRLNHPQGEVELIMALRPRTREQH